LALHAATALCATLALHAATAVVSDAAAVAAVASAASVTLSDAKVAEVHGAGCHQNKD